MRKLFIEGLPRWGRGIDWIKLIGHKIRFIYDDIEGEIKIIDYRPNCLYVKYSDKNNFEIRPSDFIQCKIGKLLNKSNIVFKFEIGKRFKTKGRDIAILDKEIRIKLYKNNYKEKQKWYKYKCNKCGYEGWIIENNLVHGIGCSCCGFNSKIVVEGINDIPTTAPWMVKYFQGGYNEAKLYTKNSAKKIYPICPDCGRVKRKPICIYNIYKMHGIGCLCGDGISYPNKFMYSVLEQLIKLHDINEFKTEYSPDWIRPKRYDFYFELNNKKYIIEMDGNFHYQDNKMNGQTKEQAKGIDNYKDKLAKEHNIQIVRIDSRKSKLEYLKSQIFNSKLNEILDLGKIDWLKCEEFASSNLIKKICRIKKDNPNMKNNDISRITKLREQTINKYLEKLETFI